jgi:glycosyltransferase involved in cell wall biosynthesis
LENLRRYFADEPAIRFSDFTAEGLAQVLVQWLNEPQATRQKLGAAASARVMRELDWAVITERAVDFFERQTMNLSDGEKAPHGR